MIYIFRCPNCGINREVSRPMAQSHLPEICDCDAQMERDYRAEHSSVRGDYSEPIISDSMAFDALDVNAHRERHPSIELQVEGRFARPILRSLSQKREYLKARGWKDVNAYF